MNGPLDFTLTRFHCNCIYMQHIDLVKLLCANSGMKRDKLISKIRLFAYCKGYNMGRILCLKHSTYQMQLATVSELAKIKHL